MIVLALLLLSPLLLADPPLIDTGTLLREMVDPVRLAHLPAVPYRTLQWSSYDRRSRGPEQDGWFANSDGFGGEPIPGFEAVLRAPGPDGVGLYLIGEADGPGAIVRTWSAGMGGVLRVVLDGSETPIFEGKAEDFLRRKSEHFLKRAGVAPTSPALGDAFAQQDADYFPIPFASGLRITWEGNLSELHFYQVGVRRYDREAKVASFDPRGLGALEPDLGRVAVSAFVAQVSHAEAASDVVTEVPADSARTVEFDGRESKGGGMISTFAMKVYAADRDAALRGTVLRIAFDGSPRPQVDAPIGDFFGAGPGLALFESLPMAVVADGCGMVCRFAMPYRESASVTLFNSTAAPVTVKSRFIAVAWPFGEDSLYFHARWRVDRDLDTREPQDLPFLIASGQGRLVGTAVQIMNPSPVPTPGGNWWGEGDEKIFVDGDERPSIFGTGTEDFFNYSWSRPDLFAHPYCAQPICSGPGTSGYIANIRWQILDDVPFTDRIAYFMELKHHHRVKGLSYARTVYYYAKPGSLDDHRMLTGADLAVSPLPLREPLAAGGAAGATFIHVEDIGATASEGVVQQAREPQGSRGRLTEWTSITARSALSLPIEFPADGEWEIHVVAMHRPDAGRIHVEVDGVAMAEGVIDLRTETVRHMRSSSHAPIALTKGRHLLRIVADEPGIVALDYVWIRRVAK